MLHKGKHREMIIRYLVWASEKTGRVSTFIWLLDRGSRRRELVVVRNTLQLLRPNLREDRVMNVKKEHFTLGIPSKEAFALIQVPQGTFSQVGAKSIW